MLDKLKDDWNNLNKSTGFWVMLTAGSLGFILLVIVLIYGFCFA